MSPKADGRMLRTSIAHSATLANLSKDALCLFFMLLPHFDAYGKMQANPYTIKGLVCPLIPFLTVETITGCLQEISAKTNIKYFESNNTWYLHALEWEEHQELRFNRRGKDKLPDCPQAASKIQAGEPSPQDESDPVPPSPTPSLPPSEPIQASNPWMAAAEQDYAKRQQSVDNAHSETIPGVLPDCSRTTPGVLPPEVEREGERQPEVKKEPPTPKATLTGPANAGGEEDLRKKKTDNGLGKQILGAVQGLWQELKLDTSKLKYSTLNSTELQKLLVAGNLGQFTKELRWLVEESRSKDSVIRSVRRKGLAGLVEYWYVVDQYCPSRRSEGSRTEQGISKGTLASRILANGALVDTQNGLLRIPGRELTWHETSREFEYKGQRIHISQVSLAGQEVA